MAMRTGRPAQRVQMSSLLYKLFEKGFIMVDSCGSATPAYMPHHFK